MSIEFGGRTNQIPNPQGEAGSTPSVHLQFKEPPPINESGERPLLLRSEPPEELAIVHGSTGDSALSGVSDPQSTIEVASANPDPVPVVVDVTAVDLVSQVIKADPLDRLEAIAFPDRLYWADIAASEDLTSVFSTLEARMAEAQSLAETSADAKCELIDTLRNEPLTPRREALWNRLLDDDLTPGPYADYLLKAVTTVDISNSSIRSLLLKTQDHWTERYRDNLAKSKISSLYAGDLKRLADVLEPRQPELSPVQKIVRAFTSVFPLLEGHGQKTEALTEKTMLTSLPEADTNG